VILELDQDSTPFWDNLNEVSPEEFEQIVHSWLESNAPTGVKELEIRHLHKISSPSGSYEIDVAIELILFGGARILIIVECKRQANPVKRDQVLTLEAKLRDTGAHKAIMVSTSGYQRGAIDFAKAKGIALVTVREGRPEYGCRTVPRQASRLQRHR